MVNAEVLKSGNESALSVIRKFSRRVQGTGLIVNARKRRYYSRTTSKTVAKKRALKRIKKRAEFHRLLKEGKAVETPQKRGFHAKPQNQPPRGQTPPAYQARFGENTHVPR